MKTNLNISSELITDQAIKNLTFEHEYDRDGWLSLPNWLQQYLRRLEIREWVVRDGILMAALFDLTNYTPDQVDRLHRALPIHQILPMVVMRDNGFHSYHKGWVLDPKTQRLERFEELEGATGLIGSDRLESCFGRINELIDSTRMECEPVAVW